jgi:hypothetical protein
LCDVWCSSYTLLCVQPTRLLRRQEQPSFIRTITQYSTLCYAASAELLVLKSYC